MHGGADILIEQAMEGVQVSPSHPAASSSVYVDCLVFIWVLCRDVVEFFEPGTLGQGGPVLRW